jgi:hypothetical protein
MDTISASPAASADVDSSFFLDPEGRHLDELQDWLRLANALHRKGKSIPPLFINGLVKVGCDGDTCSLM